MNSGRRGVTHVQTMSGLVDGRRSRTSHGALLELSMLEVEKTRLTAEMLRAEQRCADIRKRVTEIETKAKRLYRFVKEPAESVHAAPAAQPLQTYAVPENKVKSRRLSY